MVTNNRNNNNNTNNNNNKDNNSNGNDHLQGLVQEPHCSSIFYAPIMI